MGARPTVPNPELSVLPNAVSKAVCNYFVHARMDNWEDRLANYWAFQENKRADEVKYGKYGWLTFSQSYHATPDEPYIAGRDGSPLPFHDILRHLVDCDRRDLHIEGARLMAYKIRSTVAMHKRARIGTEFHGFLQLPSEIRDMVYGFALSRGTVIVPNNDSSARNLKAVDHGYVKYWSYCRGEAYKRYQGLETRLLALARGHREQQPMGLIQGVSRTVHAEASRVYFGRNRFILPVGLARHPSYFTDLAYIRAEDQRLTVECYLRKAEKGVNNAVLVRDTSYAFDMRDHAVQNHAKLYFDDRLRKSIDEESISPQDAMRRLHDHQVFELEVNWVEKIDCIKFMTLDRLELSFDECYCNIGCCRKVGWVLDRLLHVGPPPGTDDTEENVYSSADWRTRPPLVIEAQGWRSDRERNLIQEKLDKLRDLLDSIEIRFGRTSDSQEREREDDSLLIGAMIADAITSGSL